MSVGTGHEDGERHRETRAGAVVRDDIIAIRRGPAGSDERPSPNVPPRRVDEPLPAFSDYIRVEVPAGEIPLIEGHGGQYAVEVTDW